MLCLFSSSPNLRFVCVIFSTFSPPSQPSLLSILLLATCLCHSVLFVIFLSFRGTVVCVAVCGRPLVLSVLAALVALCFLQFVSAMLVPLILLHSHTPQKILMDGADHTAIILPAIHRERNSSPG